MYSVQSHYNVMFEQQPATHRSQSDGSSSESYQSAISRMRLVHRIGILMAKLVDYSLYLVMFTFSDGFANDFFESGSKPM